MIANIQRKKSRSRTRLDFVAVVSLKFPNVRFAICITITTVLPFEFFNIYN